MSAPLYLVGLLPQLFIFYCFPPESFPPLLSSTASDFVPRALGVVKLHPVTFLFGSTLWMVCFFLVLGMWFTHITGGQKGGLDHMLDKVHSWKYRGPYSLVGHVQKYWAKIKEIVTHLLVVLLDKVGQSKVLKRKMIGKTIASWDLGEHLLLWVDSTDLDGPKWSDSALQLLLPKLHHLLNKRLQEPKSSPAEWDQRAI